MTSKTKRCPNCDGNTLYASKNIYAAGGDATNLLPGLGGFFSGAEFHIVTCKDCGLMQFFAAPEALEKIDQSNKWARI
jgi:predicted nucleic-acid-binding Zn-ribbon protein